MYKCDQCGNWHMTAIRAIPQCEEQFVAKTVYVDPATAANEANARLIAAAPDLFEACRRVANTNVDTVGDGSLSDFVNWAQTICREAVDKAEGGAA